MEQNVIVWNGNCGMETVEWNLLRSKMWIGNCKIWNGDLIWNWLR